MVADRLAIIGDEVEKEHLCSMIGDLYMTVFENPPLLSRELTTTVQNINETSQ